MIFEGADFKRVSSELIEKYEQTAPATIGHFVEKGFCDPQIKPVYSDVKLVGTAFTVQLGGKDIAAITRAYELCQPGDILVVNSGNSDRYACAGEVSTFKSIRLGVKGLIVDGAITDKKEMEEMHFPCFARQVTALVGKRIGEEGAVRVPVSIGGVVVNPGDLVVADDNGIVIMSSEEAEEWIGKCLEMEENEKGKRKDFWETYRTRLEE